MWERIIVYTLQVSGMIVLRVERWALILSLRLLSASLWLFSAIVKRVFSMVSSSIILSPLSLSKTRADCTVRLPWTTPSGNPYITWKSPKWTSELEEARNRVGAGKKTTSLLSPVMWRSVSLRVEEDRPLLADRQLREKRTALFLQECENEGISPSLKNHLVQDRII